jgi:hypothetical protein
MSNSLPAPAPRQTNRGRRSLLPQGALGGACKRLNPDRAKNARNPFSPTRGWRLPLSQEGAAGQQHRRPKRHYSVTLFQQDRQRQPASVGRLSSAEGILDWGLSKFLRMVSRRLRWLACITLRGIGACRSGVLATTCSLFQDKLSRETRRLGLEQDMTGITYLSTFWPCH